MKEEDVLARMNKGETGTPAGHIAWVANRQRKFPVDRDRIRKAALFVLDAMGMVGAELSVVFVSDRRIRQLNRDYLSRNGPTDVLAFSQREGEGGDVNPSVLGDVVISTETASRQAAERGMRIEEEMDVLLVHGILHLLGYEHTLARNEAQRMARKEKSLLKEIQKRFPYDIIT